MKKRKIAKLNRIERALLLIADYLEDPNHCDYKAREHVMSILGYEEVREKIAKMHPRINFSYKELLDKDWEKQDLVKLKDVLALLNEEVNKEIKNLECLLYLP